MDRLDKLTIISVTLMLLYGGFLLITAADQPRMDRNEKSKQIAHQYMVSPELDSKIKLAANLLVQGNLEKTESLVKSLITEFPYEGKLYMLKGDIMMRRQQPVAAMYEYKEAIELNPDFLDKKTELFQGKKIKVTVEEAMAAIQSGLQKQPDNGKLKDDREMVYFMKRKIAGSCG